MISRQKLVTYCLIILFIIICPALSAYEEPRAPFLSIADIHFDPFTACDKNSSQCPLIAQLQQTDADDWEALFATYATQPPQYKQDTNYQLLESSLHEFKNIVATEHPHFVLLLGDFVGHHYRDNYKKYTGDSSQAGFQAFVKKTNIYLTHKFADTFPLLDVYTVVGNNDSYDDDNVTQPNGLFFKETAALWSSLIKHPDNKKAMEDSFHTMGYYAVDIHANCRLVVLNTTPFWPGSKGTNLDHAIQDQFNWLHQELLNDLIKHKKVIIALHTPPGADMFRSVSQTPFKMTPYWKDEYTTRFEKEIKAFAPAIMTILTAHSHMDESQIIAGYIPMIGTPAISAIYSNNPGYKMFYYSRISLKLKNSVTHYLPIERGQGWQSEYDFNTVYQPNCHDCDMIEGLRQINNHFSQYVNYYGVGTNDQPISKPENWKYYACEITGLTENEFQHCLQK